MHRMARTKILIDCDPGHDDTVAILYAARHCDLLGITTVHGNNSLDNVTRNALSVLTLGGLQVPLAKGCAEPIAGPRSQAANAHGKTGLDGTDLPEPDRSPINQHAVDFLIDTARQHKDELVLAVVGPATNVAMAIKREPRFAGWLREISVMGGTTGVGNITAVAEFNCWADPEASSMMYGCGAPIRMVGYNVTSRTGANEDDIGRLRTGGKVAGHIGNLLEFYLGKQQRYFGLNVAPMHDVCAVVPYVRDDMLTYRHCNVQVELNGALTRGMTVCDLRTLTDEGKAMRGSGEANALVALESDARLLIEHVVDTMLTYS
jgi:inosine-uridine nucleoside N-ribohydrolase